MRPPHTLHTLGAVINPHRAHGKGIPVHLSYFALLRISERNDESRHTFGLAASRGGGCILTAEHASLFDWIDSRTQLELLHKR